MKHLSLIILLIFTLSIAIGQNEEKLEQESEPFSYEVAGLVFLNVFDENSTNPFLKERKIVLEGLYFKIKRYEKDGDDLVYILQFPTITKESMQLKQIENDNNYVNKTNASITNFYWIRKDELDKLVEDGFIRKRYELGKLFKYFNRHLDYGANVSIPFKLRPKTNDNNMKITPSLTLGGYLGLKFRLNRYRPYYLHFPFVTLGLVNLDLNDNNTTNSNGDGTVLGITYSGGCIFRFNDFQFGIITGADQASGELGKDWIYNKKMWVSFSVGFTFLGKKDDIDKK
jgi:hypothetical protein